MRTIRTDHSSRSWPREECKEQPGFWWFTAVGYPVVTGTLGSLAISFQVCNITQGALETYSPGGTVVHVDPERAWAISLKSLALALSGGAWLTMLVTMIWQRKTLRGLSIATASWLASAVILFAMIGIVFSRDSVPSPSGDVGYTQGFFYGIFAAGICALIAALLAVYILASWRLHLMREDKVAIENPTLMLRTMVFQVYVLAGAAVYSAIEGWSFMNAVYWADYTILTIGIGNIVPKTHLGRSLLFPYATTGIIFLGLVVGSLQSFIVAQRDVKLRMKMKRARLGYLTQHLSDTRAPEVLLSGHSHTFVLPDEADFQKLQRLSSKYTHRNRWHIFLSSAITLFFLWFLSAAIFRRSEKAQGWTYFEALYFTFTSLSTIGYGDLYPTSNFGTAFFVFWSLLAVPVLTFLISMMGNTCILTVRNLAKRLIFSTWLPFRRLESSIQEHDDHRHIFDKEKRVVRTHATSTTEGPVHCTASTTDSDIYLFLLAQEIQSLATTLKKNPTREYSYKEWIRVFTLLGSAPHEINTSRQPVSEREESRIPFLSERSESLWMLEHLARKLALSLEDRLHVESAGVFRKQPEELHLGSA